MLTVVLAAAAGFAIALALKDDNSSPQPAAVVTTGTNGTTTTTAATNTTTSATTGVSGTTTTTTTTTGTQTTTRNPLPTKDGCIALWNQSNNSAARISLHNIATQQPVRVHVGSSADVPPKCLITVIANNGDAYVYSEGGGATYPYSPQASKTNSSSLTFAQRAANALEQGDGTLTGR